jgi:CD68 antigen
MFSKSKFFKLDFPFLEVMKSRKKRIHEIVSAHTISQGVSDGISRVRSSCHFFFLTGGWSKAEISNLKPQASNLKPQTSNLKPQTSNLKPQTSNLKPQTSNLQPQT